MQICWTLAHHKHLQNGFLKSVLYHKLLFIFLLKFAPVFRRTNELKSDIDIPNDVIMKFKQFWSDFKDTPLKGKNY